MCLRFKQALPKDAARTTTTTARARVRATATGATTVATTAVDA